MTYLPVQVGLRSEVSGETCNYFLLRLATRLGMRQSAKAHLICDSADLLVQYASLSPHDPHIEHDLNEIPSVNTWQSPL